MDRSIEKLSGCEGYNVTLIFSCLIFFYTLICRWGELDIVSGTGETSYSDTTIMYAAGYLEGALTAKWVPIIFSA